MTPETIEGRMIAQRKILARLIALLPAGEGRDDLFDHLALREVMADGQEDPGAVPAPGVAIELAVADENRLILEEARSIAARLMPG
ncbi:MAG: hypothetical protein QM656_06825 [Paracoccaceae bacterium]